MAQHLQISLLGMNYWFRTKALYPVGHVVAAAPGQVENGSKRRLSFFRGNYG